MRIIFLESVHNFGGASKSTLELAQRLLEDGHEVLVVDFWGSSKPFVEDCNKRGVPLKIIDKRTSPILLSHKSKVKTVINYTKYLLTLRIYKKRMQDIVSNFQPDLIGVNNIKSLAILPLYKEFKVAYFVRVWFLPSTLSVINKRLLNKYVDVYLTVSQATKQMVYSGGFANLKDIHVLNDAINFKEMDRIIGLDQQKSPWHLSENEQRPFVMMHCGSFIETKGQHISIEVLRRLRSKGINTKLLLVGLITQSHSSKLYYDNLKKLVGKYELTEYIDFIVNESDVFSYYKKSDLLIHPSYSEGLPRVILEAMSFGNPVVGNAVGGVTDLILNTYTGFLPNFNAVDEYVEYIETLIYDREKYKFIAGNAIDMIKTIYTVENQIKAFNKISFDL